MFEPLAEAMRIKNKLESYGTVDAVLSDYLSSLADDDAYTQRKADAKHVFHTLKEKVLRDEVLNKGVRYIYTHLPRLLSSSAKAYLKAAQGK